MCLEQNYFCGPFANYIPGTMASSSGYAADATPQPDATTAAVAPVPQDTNSFNPSDINTVTPTVYIRVD